MTPIFILPTGLVAHTWSRPIQTPDLHRIFIFATAYVEIMTLLDDSNDRFIDGNCN